MGGSGGGRSGSSSRRRRKCRTDSTAAFKTRPGSFASSSASLVAWKHALTRITPDQFSSPPGIPSVHPNENPLSVHGKSRRGLHDRHAAPRLQGSAGRRQRDRLPPQVDPVQHADHAPGETLGAQAHGAIWCWFFLCVLDAVCSGLERWGRGNGRKSTSTTSKTCCGWISPRRHSMPSSSASCTGSTTPDARSVQLVPSRARRSSARPRQAADGRGAGEV